MGPLAAADRALLIRMLALAPPQPASYWNGATFLLAGALILAVALFLLFLFYSLWTSLPWPWLPTIFVVAAVAGLLLVVLPPLPWLQGADLRLYGMLLAGVAVAGWLLARLARLGAGWLRRSKYVARRLFEVWASAYMTVILALALIGIFPDLVRWLLAGGQENGGAGGLPAGSGTLALLSGLVTAGFAFRRSGAEVTAWFRSLGYHVSGGIVATVAAGLILLGVALITYNAATGLRPGDGVGMAALAVLLAALLLGWIVDVNHVSLGQFYRDRLMEAFMPGHAAAQSGRTGRAPAAADAMRLHEATALAPYHIVNTNVVLVAAKDRRRRIRGGDSFMLTRDHCGSNATGWCPTSAFMEGRMTLATAMAISGAAANPNTGVGGVGLTRSHMVSWLMALLNLRLGYWVPHPSRGRHDAVPNHFHPALSALLRGYHERYRFQELTDGGHFENLGLYELIRRRVRLIVVCDGTEDRGFQFESLQTALRRIGEDFGARVEFLRTHAMEDLMPAAAGHAYPRGLELAKRGFALAHLYYPSDLDPAGRPLAGARPAHLIYLKTTLVRDLPLELLGYKGRNPDFPDQPTGDQFFDEDQFEAYRELGYRLGGAMITSLGLERMLRRV